MLLSRVRGVLVAVALVASDMVGVVGGLPEARSAAPPPVEKAAARPDAVSASLAARESGAPVEVSGATSETRLRWANPDGTFTDELTAGSVRTRRGDDWVPVDTTLRAGSDGVRPRAVVGDVVFSSGNGALATVTDGDISVSLGWRGRLSAPTLDGSTARYADVTPGVDIELAARPAGFEQSFVVKDRRGVARSYHLPLTLRGVTAVADAHGTSFRDGAGNERAWIGAARMWDRTGRRMASVRVSVGAAAEGAQLEVTPDAAFMSDPEVAYPVTIDPMIYIRRWVDTYADSATPAVAYGGSGYLKIGKQGTSSLRSFIAWDLTDYVGKHITDVYEYLGNWYSASCLAKTTSLYRVTQPWTPTTLTWNNQPGIDTASGALATATSAAGGATGGGCDGTNWMTFHDQGLTDLFNAWANGAPNYGHTIRTSETDLLAAKTFLSGEATSWTPRVRITYNNHPATVAGRYVTPAYTDTAGTRWTSSRTPTFAGGSCDPDASDVRIDHELWNATQTSLVSSSALPPVASCAYGLWTVGSALADGTYKWRARAYDGTDYSKAWSSWVTTVVDTTAPGTPTASSTSFPQNLWSGSDSQSGTVTFGPNGSTDVVGYYYGLDDPAAPTYSTNPTVTLTPSEGAHTLYVSAADRAGNKSAVRQYPFGVGDIGISSPAPGARTQKTFTLSVTVRPDASQVSWYWRRGTSYWVGMTNMRNASGQPVSELYVSNGVAPVVTWDVPVTVGGDGAIEIMAQVNGSTFATLTKPRTVMLDRTDYAAVTATVPLGPGVANLLTGNIQVTQNDVSVSAGDSALTVSRTYNSRGADSSYSPLGPEWRLNVAVPSADSEYASLDVVGAMATLTFPGGDDITFVANSAGTWASEPGAEDLTLTAATGGRYSVTDLDGNVTTFLKHGTSTTYLPTSVRQAGHGDAATYAYESVSVAGTSVTRVTGIMAPEPTAIDGCSLSAPLSVVGCRSLTFDYAPATTPVPLAGTPGDFAHRVRTIFANLYDPEAGAMRAVAVARFGYDPQGRLVDAWDPRLPSIRTTYGYDAVGRLATATPGGGVPWTIAYADLGAEVNSGRVRSVSRPTLLASPTEARWTVVFEVPLTGSSAPHDMSPGQLDRIGQKDRPVTATAIFPPDTTTSLGASASQLPATYDRAYVHYLDKDGRAVNVGDPAGGVSTAEYDDVGRLVRTLSPDGRTRALDQGLTTAEEAAVSRDLSTSTTYTPDGLRMLETFGPERMVRLASTGDVVRARPHSTFAYDEGAPSGGPYNLVTTTVAGVRVAGEATDRPGESRATKTEYGTTAATWTLGQATATITDAGGANSVSRRAFTSDGRILSETLPAGGTSTTTAATRLTRYFTEGTHPDDPACGNRDEWADLVCSVGPGGQPASGPALPTTYFTYDLFENVVTAVEKAGSQTLRTTATEYDDSERVERMTVTASTGTALPTVEFGYDAYGNPDETRTVAGGVVTSYVKRTINALGQITQYRDADGVTATTSYDVAGRVAGTFDGKGSQTFSYGDPRGMPTTLVDAHTGTWTASYDVAGAPTVDWPNGVRETWRVDEAGAVASLTYTRATGCTTPPCVLLGFSGYRSIHGELLQQTSTLSSQTFGYDGVGRLTSVADVFAGACTTRRYTYDGGTSGNSNRTKLEVFAPGTPACDTSAATSTVTSSYDAADRLTTSGTSYDALGRTLSVAAGDVTSGGGLTVGYYANDLVAAVTQGGATTSYTLDVDQERVRSWSSNGVTRTNHFSDDSDKPSWVQEGATAWTRNVVGIRGDLAAIRDSSGTTKYQLANLHGDVVATMVDDGTVLAETFESTEFGAPRDGTARRYGWLGAKRRSSDALGGLSLMGVRLYNPTTGRFLQPDPVYGGSANDYDYAAQNPITNFDLDGRTCISTEKCGPVPGAFLWNPIRGAGAVRIIGGVATVTLSTGVVIYVSTHAIDPYELIDRLRRMAHRKRKPIENTRKPHRTMKNGKAGKDQHQKADGHGGHFRKPNKNKQRPKPKPKKDNGLDDIG